MAYPPEKLSLEPTRLDGSLTRKRMKVQSTKRAGEQTKGGTIRLGRKPHSCRRKVFRENAGLRGFGRGKARRESIEGVRGSSGLRPSKRQTGKHRKALGRLFRKPSGNQAEKGFAYARFRLGRQEKTRFFQSLPRRARLLRGRGFREKTSRAPRVHARRRNREKVF